jgi:hypothetical protein
MKFASGFLATVVLIILFALAVPYSGVFNVAATEPDNPVTAWFPSTMQRSVRQQARGVARGFESMACSTGQ